MCRRYVHWSIDERVFIDMCVQLYVGIRVCVSVTLCAGGAGGGCRCICIRVYMGWYKCMVMFVSSCAPLHRSMCKCFCMVCTGGAWGEVCVSIYD